MELREVTVSGYRGAWGKTLTPDIGKAMANAFVKYTGAKKIAIGMDTRPSGPLLKKGVVEGLNIAGTTAVDMGIVPTPTACINAKDLGIPAIMITASHNSLKPIHWNGLKFIGADGLFLNEGKVFKFGKIFGGILEGGLMHSAVPGGIEMHKDPFGKHLSLILQNVDAELIIKQHFLVALDAVNGAGSVIAQKLLEMLGCTVVPIYTDMEAVARSGDFPRGPEPTPENITELCKAVKNNKARIGFALDPDADRLAIVSELGVPFGEENTLTFIAYHLLSKYGKKAKALVTNQSTTRAMDDVAEKFGVHLFRTKIGEINVVVEMIKQGSLIGGEGNGGVIFPLVCSNRDSLSGMALALEFMAENNLPLSWIGTQLPSYFMRKAKSQELSSKEEAASAVKRMCELYKKEKLDFTDGIKVVFKDGSWVHLRASNTEPIIRIIAEASTQEAADKLVEEVAKKLKIKLVNEKE